MMKGSQRHRQQYCRGRLKGIEKVDAKASSPKENVFISLVEAERRHIDKVLKACGQNVNEAARVLGASRSTQYRKIEELGIRG